MYVCRSEYTPSLYQNGGDSVSPTPVENFSFSDLPNLDFGSPDEDEGDYVFLIVAACKRVCMRVLSLSHSLSVCVRERENQDLCDNVGVCRCISMAKCFKWMCVCVCR